MASAASSLPYTHRSPAGVSRLPALLTPHAVIDHSRAMPAASLLKTLPQQHGGRDRHPHRGLEIRGPRSSLLKCATVDSSGEHITAVRGGSDSEGTGRRARDS
eukprot:42563-Eustigmatos_ZCMA.PRE.1